MITSLKDLPYEERLRRLRLTITGLQETAGGGGDMINTYKYVNGIYTVSANYIDHSDFTKPEVTMQLKLEKKQRGRSIVCVKPSSVH